LFRRSLTPHILNQRADSPQERRDDDAGDDEARRYQKAMKQDLPGFFATRADAAQ